MPVAVNCWVAPWATEATDGDTVMDKSRGEPSAEAASPPPVPRSPATITNGTRGTATRKTRPRNTWHTPEPHVVVFVAGTPRWLHGGGTFLTID